ncbi:MAG: GntG family PLP-dependent aldolase [Acidobacteriota bacterium]
MQDNWVDLRSDTVTRPTPAMRKAMAEAPVGDDVYGEDPTVNALQEKAAALLGKEAALFVPSGSMGNQTAVKVHTQPGDEVVCESSCHIYNIETGMMAAFSGVLPRLVSGKNGILDPKDVENSIRAPKYYLAPTTLLAVENTHNMAGGTCTPVETLEALCSVAKKHGMGTHLDGARIFNAAAALGCSPAEIARPFDSVMFCISKGLGAPVGSLLCGSRSFIERARKVRKMMGGGMRQAGILAAAGLVAFEEILPTLPQDHQKARRLAEKLAAHPDLEVDLDLVQTNIFMCRVKPPRTPSQMCEALERKGVIASPMTRDTVRFVTHHDVTEVGMERALVAFEDPFD